MKESERYLHVPWFNIQSVRHQCYYDRQLLRHAATVSLKQVEILVYPVWRYVIAVLSLIVNSKDG